jgi:hypothetical protein
MRKSSADAAGRFRKEMRMAGDLEYFLRVLRVGALGVVDRIGCRITVHDDQVGTRLSLEPEVMQEQFCLVDEFGDYLGDDRARRDVRRAVAGLSLWQALRSALGCDLATAGAHLRVARRNGTATWELALAFGRLLIRRVRWRICGPFVPSGVVPDGPLATAPSHVAEQ